MSWEIKHNITAPFNDEELLANGLTVIHQINPVTQANLAQIQSDWSQSDNTAVNFIKNKPSIPDQLSNLSDDENHRLVTDEEKTTWNNKQASLGFTPENLANKSTDGTFASNSDTKYPSEKAVKTYVDNHSNSAPGVIFWTSLADGATITAGQSINYNSILYFCKTTHAIGTPKIFDAIKFDREGDDKENASNKRSSFQVIPDNDHYPSEKLVKDNIDNLQAQLNANNTTFSAIYAYNNFI